MKRKTLALLLTLALILTLACSLGSLTGGGEDAETPLQSEGRCGDGVCDGPENAQKCPEDCPAGGANIPKQDSEEEGESPSGQEEPDEADVPDVPDSGYRYVSFGGTVQTTLNTETMGDFTGKTFEYSGDYQIELWFPLDGGDVVQQRNTIVLTEFNDLYFDSEPCVWELEESAFEPASFDLVASLTLDGIQENGQPADELAYQLVEIPQKVIGGVVTCEGSPGDFSDPAAYPVLTSWLTQGITNPIHLNAVETNTVEHQSVTPIYYIDIPRETLSYTTVPDLETP